MVTVLNSCDADSVAGNALILADDGDFFTSSELNLTNITHYTTSAWIKPDGGQSGFAGIVTNGEWCAHCNTPIGLIFDYYGNRLYYRWPDGSGWGNNSGMTVPLNTWSYVAMVVTPDSVTLYMNEQRWVSYVTLSPVDFPTLYIGKGHYSGYFKGDIDEVTIWDRALSQDEIRELRHLTKKDIIESEPGLVAYYQFNTLAGSTIFDNANDKHGQIAGGTTIDESTAPVGPGKSMRTNITSNGSYSFPDAGLEINFGSTHPDGEIVVSRLNVSPNILPNSNPTFENYWIINNYGTSTFDPLNSINFESSVGIPIGDPANARLHVRSENAHSNSWTELCGAENFSGDTYNYNNTCNVTNTHQFVIQSDDNFAINKLYLIEYIDTTICSNESIFLQGAYQNTPGTYYDTVVITPSIDSVYITTLYVNLISSSIDVIIACDSLTWIDGNTYYTSQNNVFYTLTNAANCDSVILLDLTMNYSSSSEINVTSCISYTVPSGDETYYESGTYMDTIPNAVDCDSIMTIYLDIIEVDTSVTVNSPTLTSNEVDATYQWLDCELMQAMAGETNQSYTATTTGIYAVIVTKGGCTDTSGCYQIAFAYQEEDAFGNDLSVFPNPTTGSIMVDLGKTYSSIRTKITNVIGRVMSIEVFKNTSQLILEIEGAPGYYFVEIFVDDNNKATIKVLKE